MSKLTRRKLITTGLAATVGASGLAVAGRLARRYGLIPPDAGGLYGLALFGVISALVCAFFLHIPDPSRVARAPEALSAAE